MDFPKQERFYTEHETVIPNWRLEELLRAETERDIILAAAARHDADYVIGAAAKTVFAPYLMEEGTEDNGA